MIIELTHSAGGSVWINSDIIIDLEIKVGTNGNETEIRTSAIFQDDAVFYHVTETPKMIAKMSNSLE